MLSILSFLFSISNSLCCKYVICVPYLCRNLQKKCHVLKIGSQRASAGKYLTSLISLYTLWRLCPSFDLPKRFLSSCFPKFPASSTSFSTNLPYFSFGGTISREAGMPNTSCMIYMIAPANFHIIIILRSQYLQILL